MTETEGTGSMVYDAENDEEVRMGQISINERDKAFFESLRDADGYVTTQELGQLTGLDRHNLRYRYNKYGRDKYKEILDIRTTEDELLPKHLDHMQEVKLTERGETLIRMGLLGDPAEEYKDKKVTLDEEDYDQLHEEIEHLEHRMNALKDDMDNQKNVIREIQATQESIQGWKDKINTFVMATRFALKRLSVDFSECLKEAREEKQNK